MDNLNLNTIELVSTERKVPLDGAPSSLDYNDSQTEVLADLAAITSFINDTVLPLINALPATALSGLLPTGLEGRTIYSDTTDVSNIFYNGLSQTPLTVAESIRMLSQMLNNFDQKLRDIDVSVDSLQQRLSSDNRSDLALTLQNLNNTVEVIQNQQTTYSAQVVNVLGLVQGMQRYRLSCPVVAPGAIESILVTWSVPFASNDYVVQISMEDDSGYMEVLSFSYVPDGSAVLVRVKNTDAIASHQGFVHVTAFMPVAS